MLKKLYHNNFGSGGSVWDQAQFYAPLTKSLVLSRGTGNPTFTRATTAYVEDFEGVWRQVPSDCARFTGARLVRNLISTKSEDYSAWTLTGCTATASRILATAGGTYHYAKNASGTTSNGVATYAVSVEVKKDTTDWIWFGFSDGDIGAYFNLATGAWGNIHGSISQHTDELLSDGYYLLKLVGIPAAVPLTPEVGLAAGNGSPSFSAAGTEAVYARKHQLENITGATTQTPSDYVSVGVLSAPYHGAGVDGVKYFDTELDGTPIPDATLQGYFAEGQRTNRCLHSQDFTNAAWVSGGGGITVTANSTTAPDGTTTADTLTASGANGTLIQDLGVVASAAKAGGLYLKRKTGTGNIDLTLDGGATWTTVAVTSDWLLLEKTQTLADEDFGIRIVTSGDEVYAWQGQVETKAYISSPIPTTTAAVTRNGDVLTYVSTGNISGTIGTAICESHLLLKHVSVSHVPYYLNSDSTADAPILYRLGGLKIYDGTMASGGVAYAGGSTHVKMASVWGSSGRMNTAVSGTLGTDAAFDGTLQVGTNFSVGHKNGSQQCEVPIRNVRIWTKAFSDAQLMSMTA